MLGLQKHRATHVSKIVDMRTLPKLPKDPRMLANNGGVPLGKSHRGLKRDGASSLTWTAGSKTKLTDGKSVLTRARREAKEISQMSKLAKPTHQLRASMGQVVKAPAGMVNEYRTAAQPALKILSRKTPVVKRLHDDDVQGMGRPSLEEREARLRTLTSGGVGSNRAATEAVKATIIGTSYNEDTDDEDDEIDDLTHEEPKSRLLPTQSSRLSKLPPRQFQSSPAPQRNSLQLSSSPPSLASGQALIPSAVINSIVSKSRLHPTGSSPPQAGKVASTPGSRKSSPGPGPEIMMPKKRKEVDIFNRRAKRPRVREKSEMDGLF